MANENARMLRKNLTWQEVRMWVRLRGLRKIGLHFRRQAPVGPYIVDFLCLKHHLIIEIDGGQHADGEQASRDTIRDAYLKNKGFRVTRFWNSNVDENIEGIVETIVDQLKSKS